jgi:hypothetical protein
MHIVAGNKKTIAMALLALGLAMAGAIGVCRGQEAPKKNSIFDIPDQTTQPAAPLPTLSADQQALVDRLDGMDGPVRKAAEEKLNQIVDDGPANLPIIQAMFEIARSRDARDRLGAAIDRLIREELAAPTLITLHMKDAPVKDVYAALFRQAGVPDGGAGPGLRPRAPTVSIDVTKQPFWEVIKQLEPTTGLSMQLPNLGSRMIALAPQPAAPVPCVINGPVLVEPQGIQFNYNVRHERASRFWLKLNCLYEPKLNVVGQNCSVHVIEAVDDHGNSLLCPGSDPPGPALAFLPFTASLKYPPKNPGKRIARFRGSIRFTVASSQTAHFEIDDILHAKPQTIAVGQVNVHFQGCTRRGALYTVHFSFDPNETHTAVLASNSFSQAHLQSDDGRSLRVVALPGFPTGGETISPMFGPTYPGRGPEIVPSKLVWDLPVNLHEIEVPVEFSDLDINVTGQ